MSGAAGGSRIKKEDLKATIRDYRENILKPLGLDKSYKITGVRSRPEKDIFGDIDIVVSFQGGEKKELKQELAKFLSQVDKIPIIPRKNNKYFIHGNIVSTLYPIIGKEGEYVQIDNIVTTSEDEGKFTFNMLDLPAQEQTLAIGLAKTVFTELDEKQIEQLFKELNVPTNERPAENEEYDFNLNPSELSLRIVPIGKNDGREIWKSNKFEDVKKLTSALGVDIEKDKFDNIVSKIKKFKNRRSVDRLKGMFAKNIRVGDAEKGIEKGIKKQQAIDTVAALENKYSPLVMSLIKPFIEGETMILEDDAPSQTIALMPGAFKPPHKDHLRRINAAAENSDKAIILISPLDRVKEGEMPISAKQSLAIWQLYKDKGVLDSKVEFLISQDNAPVKTAYDIATANPNNQYIGVYGKDDAVRWKNLPNEKYPNLRASDFGIIADLSASGLRKALADNADITPWLPDGITPEEYKNALGLEQVQEVFEPSSNIYDYTQNGLDYYFTTKDGDNYVAGITPESDTRIAIDFGIADEEGDIGFQETNKEDIYKIIATVSSIVKDYLDQHPDVEIISWSSVAKTGEKKIGETQRDKIYKLIVKKQSNLKDEDIVRKDSEYWAYLKGYNPMFENELPAPTQNFFNPIQDKQLDLNISSEPTRVDYYKDHIQNVIPSDFKVEKHKDKIVVTPTPKQQNLENNLEFKELLVSLTMYMMDHINIDPLPDLIFVEDDVKNAKDMLGRTAHYNHNDKSITLYTHGRHPKDVLRSYAHEMIHHKQNLEGRLQNQINTQNINEDDYLKEIEEEAYRLGNGLLFRGWENSIK
jgi:hypothetical protein